MNYSIIIVNYKAPGLVVDCLQTIFTTNTTNNFEVIIVDNFSGDDSETIIKSWFPQVRWIQMGSNSGFARANNAGIRAANGKIVLLLNSDTLNENDAIAQCANRLEASDYLACGVQLLNPDGSPQISGNYFTTGGLNQLMMLPIVGKFARWLGYAVGVKSTNVPTAKGIVEVDWINGAFLMAKKDAIDKAGLLNEDFFLYFEEIEWCSRLRKIGKMCIYGDLHVIHLMGATADKAFGSTSKGYSDLFDRKGLQIMVSAMLRIRKQYGIGWYLFHLLSYLFAIPVFFIGVLLTTIFQSKNRYSFTQFAGYVANCMKLLSFSGRMIRNKPYFYKVL